MSARTAALRAVLARLPVLWGGIDGLTVVESSVLESEDDMLVIALDDAAQNARSIAGARTDADYGGGDFDLFDVQNLLTVWIGDADVKAAREKLLGYLDALDAALDGDATLGGACARARITNYELATPITGEGATADLWFTLHVQSWR